MVATCAATSEALTALLQRTSCYITKQLSLLSGKLGQGAELTSNVVTGRMSLDCGEGGHGE
jgi:hypothetical protein